ncbi:DUF5320 family protein [Chloroflexota bacterium]
MPNGFGRGSFGRGGGWGFGFRGASPPWPHVGLGRGGLSRCGYFLSNTVSSPSWPYQPPTPQMTKEEELAYLRNQAEGIKEQLDQIDLSIRNLEGEQKK